MKGKIFALDIGKRGGIAIINKDNLGEPVLFPMPVDETNEIDYFKLHELFRTWCDEDTLIVFEYLTPLHLASKSANWSLALQAGAIEMACIIMDIIYRKIPAKEWQKQMFEGLPVIRSKKGPADTKTMAYVAACRIFPNLKLQKSKDGMTDALLIAEYGRRNIKN